MFRVSHRTDHCIPYSPKSTIASKSNEYVVSALQLQKQNKQCMAFWFPKVTSSESNLLYPHQLIALALAADLRW